MDRQVTVRTALSSDEREDKGHEEETNQPNLSRPKFTKTSGPGAGFRYCVDLQAGMSKFHVSDVRVHGNGRLGYGGGGASADERDLPCRTDAEAKNLAAAVALYALFPDQNIYLQLPQPFRDLWKSWMKGVEEDAAKEEKEKHMDKVSFCIALEEAWHNDPRSKQHRMNVTRLPLNDEGSTPHLKEGVDWEDDSTKPKILSHKGDKGGSHGTRSAVSSGKSSKRKCDSIC